MAYNCYKTKFDLRCMPTYKMGCTWWRHRSGQSQQ